MRILLAIILLQITFTNTSYGQAYPKGAYMSLEQLQSKTPSLTKGIAIEKRSKGDVKLSGGNDYKLISRDKTVKKRTLKKEIFAYSDGNTLYINGYHYKTQSWYSPVISDGKFLVFEGCISSDPKVQMEQIKNKIPGGYIHGSIGGAMQGTNIASLRFIYAIDKNSNSIESITSTYLRSLLYNYPHLKDAYDSEKKPTESSTYIRYLKGINETP